MIDWIVTSSVLIAIVAILRWSLSGKIHPCLQYALWAIVLMRLLLPVQLGQSSFSVLNDVEPQQELHITGKEPFFYIGETPDLAPPVVEDTTMTEAEQAALEDELYLEYLGEMAQYATPVSLSTVLYGLWIAGGLVTAAVLLVCNLRFARTLRRSHRETGLRCGKLPVYVSAAAETPCLVGLFHPVVYVTEAALSDETTLRHALAHEETHYRHGDHLWSALRCLCLVLHWYNPLVWLAAALSRRDAELACDEGTLQQLGDSERTAYGETLIALTCGRKRGELLLAATTMTGSKRTLRQRITRIAHRPKTRVLVLVIALMLLSAAIAMAFTGSKDDDQPTQPVFSRVDGLEVDDQTLSAVRTYILTHAAIFNELAGEEGFITEASLFSVTPNSTGGAAESAMCMYDIIYYFQCSDPFRLKELADSNEFADKWEAEGTNGSLPILNDTIHYGFRGEVLAPYSSLGSGADVEQTPAVAPDPIRLDAALERLRTFQPEELADALVDGRFAAFSSEEITSWIHSAAEHRIDRTEPLSFSAWNLQFLLPRSPSSNLETQELISLSAGPREENILEVTYRSKDMVSTTFYVEDSQLYWNIRSAYRTEDTLDAEAMAPYRALLETEVQAVLDRSANWPQPLSGYEIISFRQATAFRQEVADYAVYNWDVAFLSDDPAMAGWSGGMWLDDQCRIRQLIKNTHLLVRTVDGETDCLLAANDWLWESQQDIVDAFAAADAASDRIPVRYEGSPELPDAVRDAAVQWVGQQAQAISALTGDPDFIAAGEVSSLAFIDTPTGSEFILIRIYALDYRLRLRVPAEVNMQLDGMTYSEDAEGLWLVEKDSADEPILVMVYRINEDTWSCAGTLTSREIDTNYGGGYIRAATEFYESVRDAAQ